MAQQQPASTGYFTAETWQPVLVAAMLLSLGAAGALLIVAGTLWALGR